MGQTINLCPRRTDVYLTKDICHQHASSGTMIANTPSPLSNARSINWEQRDAREGEVSVSRGILDDFPDDENNILHFEKEQEPQEDSTEVKDREVNIEEREAASEGSEGKDHFKNKCSIIEFDDRGGEAMNESIEIEYSEVDQNENLDLPDTFLSVASISIAESYSHTSTSSKARSKKPDYSIFTLCQTEYIRNDFPIMCRPAATIELPLVENQLSRNVEVTPPLPMEEECDCEDVRPFDEPCVEDCSGCKTDCPACLIRGKIVFVK